ncbi:MAG: branched-chain amino acid permease [Actinobacteria bacterium]|nr:MAG: branched-chain amino acid permease [Actinomycetota bacterium]
MPRREFRDGVRAILGLTPAAFAFGASFAVLARAAGVGGVAATVMSATTFAGSAQVATVSILGTGGGLAAAVVAALLLNARYGAISVSVAPGFRGSLLRRLVESQLIVDESWAVSVQPDGRVERGVLLGAGATLWIFWTTGTVAGAVAGEAIGDPNRLGLDGAFPALFLALLAPQLRSRRAVAAAAIGAAIAFALIPFTPAGVPIVAATAGCLVGWRR